ncbi:JAB domain-containing protein [Algoriphagus sp. AGSA1]|uniref:JAB domain-containing protein n=1 Tax=Algoriphagus sp. AGSA1 TaxID=2907213 RepID=UPI001F19DDD4|nr:JAB domain-containing protein [Algoriphagus sp. AGSA1]MCE7056880.1 JAB domain-containing protein [Algoriphagus sp. AGSA1]
MSVISDFKAAQIQISYRNRQSLEQMPVITKSSDAYNILKASWDENKLELVEQFKIILMDNGNRCLGVSEISSGGISSCIVDQRIVFATALKGRAVSLILGHNHPSGRLSPSQPDIRLTTRLCRAGEILDIKILDHIIVTRDGHYSFADEGMMP